MLQATVLRLSVVVVCTERIVAKQCVLQQKLLLTDYRKYMRNRLVPMNDLDLCLEVVQGHVNHIAASSPKLLEPETSNLVHGFVWGNSPYKAVYQVSRECRAYAQKFFPKSGRGLDHVTPTYNFQHMIEHILLELVTSNLVRGFVLPLLFDYRVVLTIVYCETVRPAILATAWLLVLQCCVRLSVCNVCIVAKRCILEQSYYWQPIGSSM